MNIEGPFDVDNPHNQLPQSSVNDPAQTYAHAPYEYPPFKTFSQWKNNAQCYDYFITIGNENIQVPDADVRYFASALSFNQNFGEEPIKVTFPVKIEIVAHQKTNHPDEGVGNKRKMNDRSSPPAAKRMRTNDSQSNNIPTQKDGRSLPARLTLYSETVYTIKDDYWSDRSGKLKLIISKGAQHNQAIICALYCTIHGQRLSMDQINVDRKAVPPNPMDNHYGLKNFMVYVTIRDIVSSKELYHVFSQQNFYRVESPFRQTISFKLLKETETIPNELVPFNKGQLHDSLRLVADVTIFDCNQKLFFSRSGFMWLDAQTAFPIYHGALLTPPNEHGSLSIQFQVGHQHTLMRACHISISLSKIVSWFDKHKGTKMPAISKLLLDISKSSESFDIFDVFPQ